MMRIWAWLTPHKLRNKLWLAFLCFIIFPLSILMIYFFYHIQMTLQDKVSQSSHEQLIRMEQSLDDLMTIVFKTLLLIESDSTIGNILKHPDNYTVLERRNLIEEKIVHIDSSLFLFNSPFVFYTIADFHQNLYTSFQPDEKLDAQKFFELPTVQKVINQRIETVWVPQDDNYLAAERKSSPYLITLFALLRDSRNEAYGVTRISMNYANWFHNVTKKQESPQDYLLMSSEGELLAHTAMLSEWTDRMKTSILNHGEGSGYFTDHGSKMLVNYTYNPRLRLYLVNRIPLDSLYEEINKIKHKYIVAFFSLTILFVFMTYFISRTVTNPLNRLQLKMSKAVNQRLNVYLPTDSYRGEILQLTVAFNQMMSDLNAMIEELKREQKQREAVRFQMLLSQMNPHFLLNTLNTVKGIALRDKNKEITEICLSLGDLLETSLNSEVELIRLEDELVLVEAFVRIQQYRYKKWFEISLECDERLRCALVPKLSLQPIVENAIFHGFCILEGQGIIRIGVKEENHQLVLEIQDNGIGIHHTKIPDMAPPRRRQKIGIKNLQERLDLLFKENAKLEFVPIPQGTLVRIQLPLLLSPPFSKGGAADEMEIDIDRGR
ncbi:histidine kinase [Paenibacillus sp. HWE-109]|uniref:sensor histidine kinase n=1 Tax=Paenibacillus sp. HWE-109 TaxID=1306526 RepID=UPI001EDCDF47|nr:histidine kinase [Paenibacillus sp. HWE-109]UKS28783.1 histidine kinase [Paenibacillus sp. HWE-109]